MSSSYSGILFGLLTVLSWTLCIFPFTEAARRLGSNSLNHFRLLLAILLLSLVSMVLDAGHFLDTESFGSVFSGTYLHAWIWLGISGIAGLTIGDYCAFRMYAILGARVGSVLTTLAPAASLLVGAWLTHEHISFIGIAGICITISGIALISFGKKERERIPDRGHGSIAAGIFWGVLGACGQGAGLVMAKKGMLVAQEHGATLHPVHATFMRVIIAFLVLLLITVVTGQLKTVTQPLVKNQDKGLKHAVLGTLFGPFLGVSLSLFTVARIEASVAQTIFGLVPVTALFFAAIFLKERITLQSLAGVIVAISGVTILIWREAIAGWLQVIF